MLDIVKTMRIPSGRYVVAVSGGVDSVALLHMLAQLPHVQLTVAHFDHGIRPDSRQDRLLVEKLARQYGLPFVYAEGKLGESASENKAREARYAFLDAVRKQTAAQAIITAHHQDDAVETAVHNVLRGTGRKGMTSLKSVDGILRPLLHVPKEKLREYAGHNNLTWREDSTNTDLAYRRNYLRHVVVPRLKAASPEAHDRLKQLIKRQHDLNHAIDTQLNTFLHTQPDTQTLRRVDIVMLPHNVAREMVAHWLRQNGKRQFNRMQLERLTMAIKTARPHSTFVVGPEHRVSLDKKHARIVSA